ncbi:MAG: c-type cytochrome [Allosphingosinicella sp.]|uniref:c-type cytochrome n=1 Tax=Allosphingosinicella sp. TaxID=2823234 RepID=UPI003927ECCD
MDNRTNTIAGWVLGAGIVLLGASLVTGEVFKAERPETMGYPIEGVEEEGGEAPGEEPIAFFLQTADAGRGEQQFRKCAACHTIEQGGAQGLGPNLWGNMGATIAHVAGYTYSDALRQRSGETWTWENMSEWLRSPRNFAPGTKMTFAGMGNPQDRADLMVYMNQMSSSPIPLPPPPAPREDGSPEEEAARAADAPAAGDMGTPQPVLNESDVAAQPEGNTGGPGAGNGTAPMPEKGR